MVRPAADKPSRSSGQSQAGGGALRCRVPPPPRDLNLHKLTEARARELESLHAVVAARTGGDYRFPRGKRRRTNSFDARIARRRRVGEKRRRLSGAAAGDAGGANGKEEDVRGEEEGEGLKRRPPPRWVRRKQEFRANPGTGYVVSGDGTRRLRTHLWLTKRFEMVKRWGFFLPLGLLGSGRGSRAILKWFKTGALLHDASYFCPVEINGPKDSVLTVLKSILVPYPLDLPEQNSRHVLCGVQYGRALLHHAGEPTSDIIAPVTYMWRPSTRNTNDNNDMGFRCVPNGVEANAYSGVDEFFCQLWIWLHAAAFGEGFEAIKDACIRKTSGDGSMVQCLSLEGKLSNFEITGFKATDILKNLLHPLDECTQLRNATSVYHNKSYILEHADDIPPLTVLSLEVHDPRDLPSENVEPLCEPFETGKPVSEPKSCVLNDEHHQDDDFVSNDLDSNKEEPLSMWMKPEESAYFISYCKDLWSFQEELKSPREEKVLCLEKHKRRLKRFYMDNMNRSQPHFEDNGSITANSCPVLLLKHHNQRWSVIFPLSWARAFWIPLVSSGARAIGLKERRWIACESGLPSFPYDFPDSKAYSLSKTVDAAALDQTMQLRPPSMRPLKVPIPPPWNCLAFSLQELPRIGEDIDISSTSDLEPRSSAASAKAASTKKGGLGGSVIRTRDSLVQLLRKTNSSNTLLFPCNETKSLHFSDLMKREQLWWIPKTSVLSPVERKPVLLRVTLHPFREGTFEEGAIVCAPTLSDIELWRSRAEEDEETLQIPQTWMISYFIERGPGEWDLQMPSDPLARQSHRWPIGFVTTGTVHRSSRLVAHALCEATLLAQLRGKQWGEMQGKSRTEIFVLVRNLSSTAYRLALASLVLEHQRDDLDFM